MSGETRKKKHGERKGKKNERMRAAVEKRHEQAGPPSPTTDQNDIQEQKPGHAADTTVHPKGGNPSTRNH